MQRWSGCWSCCRRIASTRLSKTTRTRKVTPTPHNGKESGSDTTSKINLDVRSEVGRLRQVMLHSPGREVDRMLPSMMEELLFDDILYGKDARVEHDKFRQVLALVADEV